MTKQNTEWSEPQPQNMEWLLSQPHDLTTHEKTLLELCFYPNPIGIHEVEQKYRNFARKLVAKLYHIKKITEGI